MSDKKDAPKLWAEKPVSGYPAHKLIQIGRTQLLMRFPFFGRLAMRMQPVPSTSLPTAAVDAKGRMYYNEHFLNACTIEDVMFVVAHEVMHLVQRASTRFPDGGLHRFWNMASDIVVNVALDQAKLGPRKEWRSLFLGFEGELRTRFEPKLITDHIYYELIKDAKDKTECEACKQIAKGVLDENKKRSDDARKRKEKQNDNAESGDGDSGADDSGAGDGDSGESKSHKHGDGKPCNHGGGDSASDSGDSDGGTGSANSGTLKHTCGNIQGCCGGVTTDKGQQNDIDDAESYEEWIRGILQAAESTNRGNLPGVIQDMLKELVKPKMDWKNIVRSTGTPIFGKDRYSWKRSSRRGMSIGVHLPHALPEKKGGLVFMDTSGSIPEEFIVQSASETIGMLEAMGCSSIYVGLHDVMVYDLIEVTKANIRQKLKFARGGTSHIDVFNLANGEESHNGFKLPHNFEVGMIVCFTDLMTCFPDEKPKWPVIWGVPTEYKDGKVPWGKKVEVILSSKKPRE